MDFGSNAVETSALRKDYRPENRYMQLGNGCYAVVGEKEAIKTD